MRVNGAAGTKTIDTRKDCVQVIGSNGPNSAVWKATPEIQASGERLIAAGAALAAADGNVQTIKSQLDTALNVRAAKVVEFDAAYGVYIANVESYATTPQDVTSLGVALFAKSTYALVAPVGIDATLDAAKGRLQIHVHKVPGMKGCVVEVSPNPADPASWHRLPGFGAVHKLSGYAPGTYWVRSASARASELSEFTAPVPVSMT
jgi:hypothetical protein